MEYSIGAEEIEPGRWMGWVFDLPGCVTYGRTREEALARAPGQVEAFLAWLTKHGEGYGPLFATAPIGIYLTETIRASPGRNNLNSSHAFFDDDRVPMRRDEADQVLRIMTHSRDELLALVDHFKLEQLQAPIDGEPAGSLANVIEHMAWAEWWYLEQLNLAYRREEMPEDPRAKLSQVRAWLRVRLVDLIGEKVVAENLGEQWSPRKLVRRAIWHEMDHIAHIAELLNGQISTDGRYVEL